MTQQPVPSSVSLSAARRIDEVCDRFEGAWQTDPRPRIEQFLGDAPEPERSAILRELLKLELELRRKSGEGHTQEEYESRFAGQMELIRSVFESSETRMDETSRGEDPPQQSLRDIEGPPNDSVTPSPLRFGRYQVLRPLGDGAFGTVFLAFDQLL